MPNADATFLARPRRAHSRDSGRSDASNTSIDAYEGTNLTPNTEDMRSPVSPREADLDAAATAPLLAADLSCVPHSSSNLLTRGPSPNLHSLSPCTNGSVCLPVQNAHLWSFRLDARRDDDVESAERSVADLSPAASRPPVLSGGRAVDNISFTSEVGTRQPQRGDAGGADGDDALPLQTTTVHAETSYYTLVRRILSVILPSIIAFRNRVRKMTWKQLLWVIFLVALVMVGNFMQIVMLNFWLISFPSDGTPGNYTAFAVPGIFFAILFALLLGAYVVIRRPSLRFAKHLHGWGILTGVGFADAFNSWMATYAASYTSEVLQALFTNLCPLYAVFLSKWILQDTRRYANIYITSVFVLTICGILAASLYGLIKDRHVSEGKWWILIFFLSMPVRVLMNVWQSLYMILYTHDPKFVSWLRVRFAEEAPTTVDAEEGVYSGEPDEDGGPVGTPYTCRHHHEGPDACYCGGDGAAAGDSPIDDVAKGMDNESGDDVPSRVRTATTSSLKKGRACVDGGPAVTGEPYSEGDLPVITITAPTPTGGTQEVERVCYPNPKKLFRQEKLASGEGEEADVEPASAADAVAVDYEPIADTEPVRNDVDAVQETTFGVGGEEDDIVSPNGAAAPPLPTQTMFTVRYNQGEDTIVKLVMLAGETFIQMCFTLSLLPADALPWWGNSERVDLTWDNFKEGIRCVFTIRENFLYCFLYTLGFVFTYVGCAYLNHYSAALCSIVSQLSSPVTALVLVLVPSWNVQEDGDSPWYCNVIAIVFLCIAALLYVMWEEMTDHEKVQAEYELKMEQLHVRPSSHEKPHPVVMDG